jgi:YHS domain-containing protein
LVGLFAGLLAAFHPFPASAATTERIVVNRFSGLAIEGFDPVAYFVDGQPVRGLADFELTQGGAVWRFHNEGNRASFAEHPEIYGPQFGGYDPTEVARGVTQPGNPMFFVVADQRLYLFSREANRDAFAADPAAVLQQASTRWPELERDLSQ